MLTVAQLELPLILGALGKLLRLFTGGQGEAYIGEFDVSVGDALGMALTHRLHELQHHTRGLTLAEYTAAPQLVK
jgi:hypothetical protein